MLILLCNYNHITFGSLLIGKATYFGTTNRSFWWRSIISWWKLFIAYGWMLSLMKYDLYTFALRNIHFLTNTKAETYIWSNSLLLVQFCKSKSKLNTTNFCFLEDCLVIDTLLKKYKRFCSLTFRLSENKSEASSHLLTAAFLRSPNNTSTIIYLKFQKLFGL